MSRRKQTKPKHLQSDSEGEDKVDGNNGSMTGTQPNLKNTSSSTEQSNPSTPQTGTPATVPEREKERKGQSSELVKSGKDRGIKTSTPSQWQDSSFKVNLTQITPPPRKRGRPPKLSVVPRQLADYSKSHSAIATALVLAASTPRRQSSRLHTSQTTTTTTTTSTRGRGGGVSGSKRMSNRTCEYCGVIKPTPAALQRHLRKHTGERPFVCHVCQKAYKAKRSLMCHQITHHPELGDNSFAFTAPNTSDDCEIDSSGNLTISPSTSNLLRETLATRNTAQRGKGGAKSSMKLAHHGMAIKGGVKGHQETVAVQGLKEMNSLESPTKNMSTSPNPADSMHDISINVSTLSTCTDTTDMDGEDGSLDGSRRGCPHCHKEFAKPSDLKRHLMVHTGEKPHICQFCKKGFKQPQSLNYHLKASHKLDIPLSQGLEERYLRLKTRAAMRDLAAMDGWTSKLHQERPNSMTPYNTEFPTSSLSDQRPESLDGDLEDHEMLLSTFRQPLSSFSAYNADLKPGFVQHTPVTTNEGPWSEEIEMGPRVIEVDLPQFPSLEGQVSEGVEQDRRTVPMVVQKERALFTQLDGVCGNTNQDMQVFRCCLCDKICSSMFHVVSHLSLHFEYNLVGLECVPCNLAFCSQQELEEHYQNKHSVSLNELDLKNNNHNFKSLGSAKGKEKDSSDSPAGSDEKDDRVIDDLNNNTDNHIDKEHVATESDGTNPNPNPEASQSSSSVSKVNLNGQGCSEEDKAVEKSDQPESPETTQFASRKGAYRCPKCLKCYMTPFLLDRHLAFHARQNLIETAMKSGVKFNGAYNGLFLQPLPVVPQDSEVYLQLKELNGGHGSQKHTWGETITDQEVSHKGMSSAENEMLPAGYGTENEGNCGSVKEDQSVLEAKALLQQEGIQEDVTVVMPSDPDQDEGLAPMMEMDEMSEAMDTDICESEILTAPKRCLIPRKPVIVPKKSRRKSSAPLKHRSVLREMERPSSQPSQNVQHQNEETAQQGVSTSPSEKEKEEMTHDARSNCSSPNGISETPSERLTDTPEEEDEVGKEHRKEMLQQSRLDHAGFLRNLHSAFSKVPSGLLGSLFPGNGFLPPSSLTAAAAGYLQQFPPLSGHSSFSLHASTSVSNPSGPSKGGMPLSPLSQHSSNEGEEQAEDLSLSSGSLSSPTASVSTSQPSTSALPSHPEHLYGYPRVLWDNQAWVRGARGDKSSSPSSPLPASASTSSKRLNPIWHTLSTEDIGNATSTDGRKVTSLSRTHSRLYVVNQPVDRERICTPTVLPDGRTVFRCVFCQKDFLSYSDINRHMDFHEDIRPYKCNFCEYYARTNSQLKVHMMRHQGIREYCCRLCKYKGVTQSDLNRHMKSQIHLLKSRNECSGCGEGFVTPKNLDKHLVIGCKGPQHRDEDKMEES